VSLGGLPSPLLLCTPLALDRLPLATITRQVDVLYVPQGAVHAQCIPHRSKFVLRLSRHCLL
jgi:hypothetical protein